MCFFCPAEKYAKGYYLLFLATEKVTKRLPPTLVPVLFVPTKSTKNLASKSHSGPSKTGNFSNSLCSNMKNFLLFCTVLHRRDKSAYKKGFFIGCLKPSLERCPKSVAARSRPACMFERKRVYKQAGPICFWGSVDG